MGRVLLTGDDEGLLMTRAAVLRMTQAEAVEVARTRELSEFYAGRFDVIVVCYSIAQSEYTGVIQRARQNWPDAHIVQMLGLVGPSGDSAADCSIPACQPALLVMRVNQELQSRGSPGCKPDGRIALLRT